MPLKHVVSTTKNYNGATEGVVNAFETCGKYNIKTGYQTIVTVVNTFETCGKYNKCMVSTTHKYLINSRMV